MIPIKATTAFWLILGLPRTFHSQRHSNLAHPLIRGLHDWRTFRSSSAGNCSNLLHRGVGRPSQGENADKKRRAAKQGRHWPLGSRRTKEKTAAQYGSIPKKRGTRLEAVRWEKTNA